VSETFYWHDYETWGANPFRDRPAQFAGIRTDLDFNIIGDPLVAYCRPADDVLPSPEACLITGITPQKAASEGVSEAEFIARIHAQMALPGTCTVGYNNIRFDDEITRHALYRNFFDPYAREWQKGNSRWDLIDVVRLAYALRPDGIQWPMTAEGQAAGGTGVVSFRLELLTAANGIDHAAAHDAMSDVNATIALAKLLKDKQPRLFDYAYRLRDKRSLRRLVDITSRKPLFHVSSKYPAALGCCAVVVPLARHPVNPNGIIVADLRVDPAIWVNLSVEEIKARVFVANDQLQEQGIERIPLKVVHLNKCPILVETNILKTIDPGRLKLFQLEGDKLRQHLQTLRQQDNMADELSAKLTRVFQPEEISGECDSSPAGSTNDPDVMLYSGGFFSDADRQKMEFLRQQPPDVLAETDLRFDDPRLPEMLFRYRARNFPDSLNEAEMERWERYRYHLLNEDGRGLTFKDYFATLKVLAENPAMDENKLSVLKDLQSYGESIIPYV
jgi:exodeoxyribonuclease-1